MVKRAEKSQQCRVIQHRVEISTASYVDVRQALMLRDSTDGQVRGAGIELRSVRKWHVKEAVKTVEERFEQNNIIGTVTHGRLGLGCITRSRYSSATSQLNGELVQKEVRQVGEEARMTKAVAQKEKEQLAKMGVDSSIKVIMPIT